MFTVECIRTYTFTTQNKTNNSANSVPNEEIRHGFENAVFITELNVFYNELVAYTDSSHPDFNFIIIANSYFPIVIPPPLLG